MGKMGPDKHLSSIRVTGSTHESRLTSAEKAVTDDWTFAGMSLLVDYEKASTSMFLNIVALRVYITMNQESIHLRHDSNRHRSNTIHYFNN